MLQQQRGNALEVMLQKRFTREGVGWDFKVFSSLVFYSKKNSENKAEEIFNFNIVHKSCHKAIYLELNYNLAQYLQSRDRIHRLGLLPNQETDYYIFINKYSDDIETSIDYAIYKRLDKKAKRMKNAIDSGALLYKDEVSERELDDLISDITKGILNK